MGIDYQAVPPGVDPDTWTGFTPDYARVGPDIHGNMVVDNTTNGMFIRIDTPAGDQLEQLTVSGRFDDTDIVHVVAENLVIGSTPGGPMERIDGTLMARTDAQLVVDPGIIVKLDGARINVGISAQLIAEGDADRDVIFTALLDDRFGAGGTSETSNPGEQLDRDPLPGDWGGIYVSPGARISVDHALVAFGGGLTRVEGSFAGFNALEIHQAEAARITNSTFDQNARGVGGQAEPQRAGRGANGPATIFVRGTQPVLLGNVIQGTTGAGAGVISIDPNSLNYEFLPDYGRSRGTIDRFMQFDDNQGPLIRGNVLGGNTINGMVVRPRRADDRRASGTTPISCTSCWIRSSCRTSTVMVDCGWRAAPTESLVVKLAGPDAGFVTTGLPLENADRIGGVLHVAGQPGRPVVFTALADDTVGAGQDPQGRPQTDTDEGIEIRPVREEEPGSFQVDLNFGPLIRANQEVVAAAERAARVFERLIQDPITITIDVEFEPDLTIVPDGIATLVEPETALISFDTVRSAMVRDAQDHEDFVNGLPAGTTSPLLSRIPPRTRSRWRTRSRSPTPTPRR